MTLVRFGEGDGVTVSDLEAEGYDMGEFTDAIVATDTGFDAGDEWEELPDGRYRVPDAADLRGMNGQVRVFSARDDGEDEDDGPGWGAVIDAFQSSEPGSTTRGYDLAASTLMAEHEFVTVRDLDSMYYFDPDRGIYVRKGASYVDELLERWIPGHSNESRARNIRGKIRSRNYIDAEDFTAPEGKVNVKNGVIDLERWAEDPSKEHCLLDHSPEWYFTARLEVNYEPEADDGGFLQDSLETSIPDKRERMKWLEFVGYSLEMWTTDMEKAMMMVGYSGAGKTSLQEVVKGVFGGMPTVTALAPHQIADSRFDTGALWEAAINMKNDINGGKIYDTGTLKSFISGEDTKMEKKHEDALHGEPKAKHLWTANWVPRLVGEDDAVYRRFLIVEFQNQIPEDEVDPSHRKRLREDERVREVMLNLALEARQRLRSRDPVRFTADRSREETKRTWDKWRDSNRLFLYSQFDLTGEENDRVEKKSYWRAYAEFCDRLRVQRKPNGAVSNALQYVAEVEGTGGDSDFYTGLKWKDTDAADATQHSRIGWVKSRVREYENRREGAPVEWILDDAEGTEHDPEQVQTSIDALLKRGELTGSPDGRVRLTP